MHDEYDDFKDFKDYVNSTYGTIEVCGVNYSAFEVLSEVDPDSVEKLFNDFILDRDNYLYESKN